MKLVSFVIPVYNEEDVIIYFLDELESVIKEITDYKFEIVFVDDGSKDTTVEKILNYKPKYCEIRIIEFSYNHGKQAAVTAAIHHANGEYFIYMDPDLQDPPFEVPRLIAEIEKGYDCVYGIRKEKKDSFINKIYSKIFWSFLNYYTGLNIPKNLAVYRIFNSEFAQAFNSYNEQNRFIEGIFFHIKKKYTTIEVEQHPRFAGKSKFNFKRKMNLAINAIFDFSDRPLKLSIRLGLFFIATGVFMTCFIIILKISQVNFQVGWPSLITAIIIGTGIQLFFLGIIAKYIGNIYKEVKKRPHYSIKSIYNND